MRAFFQKLQQQTRSKEAWDILKMAYSERGSNTDQHQVELQNVTVVDKVAIITK
jgi:hypothetical protein